MNAIANNTESATPVITYGVFNGVFAKSQLLMFDKSIRYMDLPAEKAHKLAEIFASDLGRLNKQCAHQTPTFGKRVSDEGIVTWAIKASGKSNLPRSCHVWCLLRDWETLSQWGLHLTASKIALRDDMAEFIAEL